MSEKPEELQTQRPFVVFFGFFDRMKPIPKSKPRPNDDSDENADQKKDAICRECDQEDSHNGDRNK